MSGLTIFLYVEGNPLLYVDPLGLEKLILFGPGDPFFHNASNKDADIPGTMLIYGHGNESSLADDRSGTRKPMTPQDLADLLRRDPRYKPGMPVIIRACRVAKDDCSGFGPWKQCSPSFAQRLADILKTPVTGPNEYLHMCLVKGGVFCGVADTGLLPGMRGRAGEYVTKTPSK